VTPIIIPHKQTRKKQKYIEGVLSLTSKGTGFVTHPDFKEDIRITPNNTKTALNHDRVSVLIQKPRRQGDQPEGVVTKIIERARTEFVGTVKDDVIVPDDKRFPGTIALPKRDIEALHDEEKVLVHVTWNSNGKPEGTLLEVIGMHGEHETEMKSIILENGFESTFPKEVEKEARNIATEHKNISDKEVFNRRDMRNVTTFTIDPTDAKDFDDALSLTKIDDTYYELGIHIADVSHYLKEGSALDIEARERGLSVYLVDRTIPMLPEVLSNDLCSLNPDEDKLTFSAVFRIDTKGNVTKRWFGKTIIRSNKRFTYEDAQNIIDVKRGVFRNELLALNKITKELTKARAKHGSIDFSTDEVRFELDKNGEPIHIYKKERLETHKLVEECMLLTNREVATFLFNKENPRNEKSNISKRAASIYRIHESPNPEKLLNLGIFLRALGYEFNFDNNNINAKDLQVLLKKVEGRPEETLIKTATLRSMAKAVYSTKNVGHFGLAFQFYTHFTSPIRRYPDLLVHRILHRYLDGKKPDHKQFTRYARIAEESSEKEVRATEAERESIKYKQVEYMEDHIGETFDGIISGVTNWGLYLEESATKAEGMVKISDLGNDYYNLDKKTYSIVGEKTKERFTLGDKVRFKVIGADLERRTLDFVLVNKSPKRSS